MSAKCMRGKSKRERRRAGEIVSSRLVKYSEDVGDGFNTALEARAAERVPETKQSRRYRRYYPNRHPSGSAPGTVPVSALVDCVYDAVVKRRFDFSNNKTEAKARS